MWPVGLLGIIAEVVTFYAKEPTRTMACSLLPDIKPRFGCSSIR